jgi:IS30 family transposase
MKEYTHLPQEQRYTIQCMKQAGNSNAVIAKQIDCDKSTVGRELRRNRSQRGYGISTPMPRLWRDARASHTSPDPRHHFIPGH